jgi:uncharacterized protein
MSLFWELWPIYVFGNFHCMGMCGPMVAFLGKSPFRGWYLLGRVFSFSMAGLIASGFGIFVEGFFERAHAGFIFPLGVGIFMIFAAVSKKSMIPEWLGKKVESCSLLLLKGGAWPTFLFGVSSVLLPCGQSAIVFAACALAGGIWEGGVNGFLFAGMTTPALFISMEGMGFLQKSRAFSERVICAAGVGIGVLSCVRAFAGVGWVSHLSVSLLGSHIVLW